MSGRRALIILLALAAAAAAVPSAAWARRTTRAVVYRPFSPSGALRMRGPTRSGYCWTSSLTTARRDAWRCMAHNEISDPCFSSKRNRRFVACATAPWRNRGIRLRLTRRLPRSMANHGRVSRHQRPWALQLYNGRRCLFSSGASSIVDGRRLNYFCTGGGKMGLWGLPSRRTEPWTIFRAPYTARHLSRRAAIRRAWM